MGKMADRPVPLMPKAWRNAFVRQLVSLGFPVKPAIRRSWLYGVYESDANLDPVLLANEHFAYSELENYSEMIH